VLVAVIYALSPLTVIAVALAPLVLWATTRGLPDRERRIVQTIVVAALAVRLAVVVALLLTSDHDNQAAGILVPDEAYTLARTLRIRNIILGIPALKYDYGIAFEDYGRTSYLWVMTAAQLIFGPSPYGMRLLGILFFLTGALLLFRMVLHSFGSLPACLGLILLVFFPTWLLWSVSLLKEPLYFLLAAIALTATVACCRAGTWQRRAAWALAAVAAVIALRDLRAGAVLLVGSGLVLGGVLYLLTASVRRFVVGASVAVIAAAALLAVPQVQQRVVTGLQRAARVHIGHVFTVGHPYKLLDEGFYVKLDVEPTLMPAEAARFALRAAASFLLVPLPNQISTRSELLQLPEHLVWYLLLAGALVGLAHGLRRDRLVTCLLVGYALPTAAVVALTNGNVGTLLRFRGLITPYLVWLGCLGFCVIMQRLLSSSRIAAFPPLEAREIREPI
jgi:hypothetical protein